MKKLLRLENTNFDLKLSCAEDVDRILEFNPDDGALKIHIINPAHKISFKSNGSKLRKIVKNLINLDDVKKFKIIHNFPVKNAYSSPFKIYLDITSECSLMCPFCLSKNTNNHATHLSLDIIKKIAKEISSLGIMYVKIGGGDPFLHPHFTKIVSILRSVGAFITISTNSMTITPQIIKSLAINKVRTSISIEGTKKTDDNLRGQGHFDRALETIDVFKKHRIGVLLRTTILKENLREISKLVELAKNKKVKIKFAYCRPAGNAVLNKTLLKPGIDYLRVIKYLNTPKTLPYVLMDEGMMFNHPSNLSLKLLHNRMCGAANRSMHINTDGSVSPCIFLGPSFSCGKIYKNGNIKDFWQADKRNRFLAVRAIRQPFECDNCDRLCKNECPANRLYFWGNFKKQDPNCLKRILHKYQIK